VSARSGRIHLLPLSALALGRRFVPRESQGFCRPIRSTCGGERALLEEGLHPFLLPRSAEESRPQLELVLQALVDGRIEGVQERVLRGGESNRGFAGQFLRQLRCGLQQLGSRYDGVEEAGRERLGGAGRSTGQDPPPGGGRSDPSGKPARSAPSRHDPEVDLGLAECRVLARDDEIARQGDLATPSEADPVYRSDDGERQPFDRARGRLAEVAVDPSTRRVHCDHLPDVRPGRERLVGRTRENDDSNFGVSIRFGETSAEGLEDGPRQNIDRRVVEREDRGPTSALEAHEIGGLGCCHALGRPGRAIYGAGPASADGFRRPPVDHPRAASGPAGAARGGALTPSVVSGRFGTILIEGSTVLREARAPGDEIALAERMHLRREGRLTPEDESILSDPGRVTWTTRDRRLADRGVRWDPGAVGPVTDRPTGHSSAPFRDALLRDAERSLRESWDPSVHVQEAVRASADLDRVRNLLGERLGSWVTRDVPELDAGDHSRIVEAALDTQTPRELGPTDPNLRDARRQLGELYRAVESTRASLERAVNASVPARTPNLARLLGPELTARMLAQAGGLERLARLPASTVQVLGAEKAFFEHLRGRAPPPRHGLLFLHPAIQSARRADRGRLARALAGKVAIAARLDLVGAPVDETLERAFTRRREELKARSARGDKASPRKRSGPPLHRAAEDG